MIHILVRAPLDPCTLFLKFKAKEKTHWSVTTSNNTTDSEGKSKTEYTTTHHSGKHKIVEFSRPIFSWSEGNPAGSYTFPFNFVLPNNIPGHFIGVMS